ncbi:MAG: hypothetical protein JWL69_4101 [Phycisphaerales bacterium]|nr:hypothetical protein [Phycisphaerales bacterium]MDB5355185.1 hypothetical protein [Phycisphaerales bacterium]
MFRMTTIFATVALSGGVLFAADPAPDKPAENQNNATVPAPATQPAGPSHAEQLFGQGSDALFRGEYDKAIDLLKKAADEDKGKASYRFHLARAYQYAGKEKEAEALLEGILKTAPDYVEAGQMLAEAYAKREQWKQVGGVLEPLLKYRHDYATYHLLAEAKYNLNEPESARHFFEEAIQLNPQSAADHYELGNIYLGGNFFALAAQAYNSALALGLDTPVLHYKLGSAYFNLRNYFGAVSMVHVKGGRPGTISGQWYVIEPAPGQTDAFRVAPPESAVYQVAKAIADGIGDSADIRFLKANIYLNAGRYKQAYDLFKELDGKVPKEDLALFRFYWAQASFGTGNYDEYLKQLQQAIALDKAAYGPTLVDAYLKVADQYNQAGNLDQYIHYLKEAVDQSPQSSSLHLQLGNAYEEAKKYAEAVVQWRMVLDLEPEHPKRLELLNRIGKLGSRPNGAKPDATTKPAGPEPKA